MDAWLYRWDLWIVVAYMAGMLTIGAWVSGGSQDVEGYALGHRRLPAWAIGLSVLGTFLSSITFLGTPAKTFAGNWNYMAFSVALVPAAWVCGRWFVPLYRDQVQLSAYEFLHARFGTWARVYAVASYALLQLLRIATVQLFVAFPVRNLLPLDALGLSDDAQIMLTLVLLGSIVIVYDTLGGFGAVVWTDVCQVVVLTGGALWCVVDLVWFWPAGPVDLLASIPADKLSWGAWASRDLLATTVLVTFLYGLTENLRNYGTDQNYVQRMLAAHDGRAAARSIWFGALAYLPLSVLFCFIGTGLYMHYQVLPARTAAAQPAEPRATAEAAALGAAASAVEPGPPAVTQLKPDAVFPHFIKHRLPLGVAGLVVAAILAAAMSTIDSCLNSVSTNVLVDVLRPLAGGPIRAVPEIYLLRGSTISLGVAGTGLACLLYVAYRDGASTLLDLWWQYAGTAGGGLFGLFLVAWLWPRTPSWAAAAAVVATIPVLVWGTFVRLAPNPMPLAIAAESDYAWLNCPLHPNLVGVAGTVVLVAVALVLGAWPGPRNASASRSGS